MIYCYFYDVRNINTNIFKEQTNVSFFNLLLNLSNTIIAFVNLVNCVNLVTLVTLINLDIIVILDKLVTLVNLVSFVPFVTLVNLVNLIIVLQSGFKRSLGHGRRRLDPSVVLRRKSSTRSQKRSGSVPIQRSQRNLTQSWPRGFSGFGRQNDFAPKVELQVQIEFDRVRLCATKRIYRYFFNFFSLHSVKAIIKIVFFTFLTNV